MPEMLPQLVKKNKKKKAAQTCVLDKWLRQNKRSRKEFAAEIDVSESALSRWIAGSRKPRPTQAAKIIEATRRAVTWADLLA